MQEWLSCRAVHFTNGLFCTTTGICEKISVYSASLRMIVIQNVGTSSPERTRRQRVKRIQWSVLLGLMVLIYGSHAPLITLTKIDGQVPFNPSSCVVMIELAKLLISLMTLFLTGGTSALYAPPSLVLVAPYAVPAILYAFNNNLVVLMQAYMDPSSYQVFSNLKIASTALLYSFCLGKRLRLAQCLALGLLMGAGVCQSYSSLDLGDPERAKLEEGLRLHITAWGLFLVLVYCCVSGLAAVYTERVLKGQKLPLSLQNLYLYVFGVAINGLSSFSSLSEKSFLDGYSWAVWAIIAGQTANGLLMSVVLKHGSGITRLFVISCSMLVNAVLSWAILGLQLTPFFLVPVSMIGLAAYLYYR
ncbi:probable UDP-sugar transporter protein SLC35A4 [Anabas testudineus]|uniref:Solute carrier family 35 member A4 n=1 Tax=Anabas testudineus TaxID=64144 RepID=A0A3Q1JAC5_ANATE|nr:probable UDP-sugar transporter protein SLC35A4 [Anabas testudineus]